MRRLIFITSDPLNPVIKTFLTDFPNSLHPVVLSDVALDDSYPVNHQFYSYRPSLVERFVLLFFKPIMVRSEQQFNKRNIYSRNRRLVNGLFFLKKIVDRLIGLPTYSEICRWLYSNRYSDKPFAFKPEDVCLTDANLAHTSALIPAVVAAANKTSHLCSLVYSWDNTHYSTLNTFSDSYLTWNGINKKELEDYYGIDRDKIFVTGSLLMDYLLKTDLTKPDKSTGDDGSLRILYPAVFPQGDLVMARNEISFITDLGRYLHKKNPQIKLIFRSYPSLGAEDVLGTLREEPWVQIYEHKNYKTISRLGNKAEKISFVSSYQTKVDEFFEADILLSAGSTYTLEYAYSGMPIIHLDALTFSRNANNHDFFERLAIYGHLDVLSNDQYSQNLPKSPEQIYDFLKNLGKISQSGYNQYLISLSTPDPSISSKDRVIQNLSKNFHPIDVKKRLKDAS